MDEYLNQKIAELKQKNLYRQPKGEWGDEFLRFDTNDYLGLAQDERVVAAGIKAAEEFGAGGQASRIAGGDFPLYDELEAALAKAKGAQAACVFGSGYLANLGTIKALMGEGDLVVMDKLAHSCLIEGAQLSGAKLMRFKHNDIDHAKEILQRERGNYKNCLLVTEEVFSMDGDYGDLEGLDALKTEFDCWLMVDGAHSIYDQKFDVDIYMGTLSKSVGCYGGFVCGSEVLIEYLKTSAKTLIYSTALPPFVIGSAIKALEIIEAEEPYNNIPKFEDYHILPIIIGDEQKALDISEKLKQRGIIAPAIRPPTVPAGTSRLRISLSAKHSEDDITKLTEALDELLA